MALDSLMNTEQSTLLVDGNNLASRAFHGFGKGDEPHPTGTGFLVMLRSVISQYTRVPKLILCFDGVGPLARQWIDPSYKQRDDSDEEKLARRVEYHRQLRGLRTLLDAAGLPVLCHQDREADDLIVSLASRITDRPVQMLSSDRDLCQAVADNVFLLRFQTGAQGLERLGPDDVLEKFGVLPSNYLQFAAMRGDTSDGLPGLSGVGDKKAAAILAAGLDVMSASESDLISLDGVGPKLAAKIVSERDRFALNVKLMRLEDIGGDLTPNQGRFDEAKVTAEAQEMQISDSALQALDFLCAR